MTKNRQKLPHIRYDYEHKCTAITILQLIIKMWTKSVGSLFLPRRSWASLCEVHVLCFTCYSSIHHHYFPLPVCGDVWWHGSWLADDLCCSLPGHPRESPPCPEEWQWGKVRQTVLPLHHFILWTSHSKTCFLFYWSCFSLLLVKLQHYWDKNISLRTV